MTEGREAVVRPVLRFGLAAGLSAALVFGYWLVHPRRLSSTVDIVGYPSFADFDYQSAFTAYRLGVYAFPVLLILGYSVLAWRGPLRRPARERHRGGPPLVDDHALAVGQTAGATRAETAIGAVTAALRMLLPAGLVAIAASAGGTDVHRQVNGRGVTWGIGYLIAVLVIAAALAAFTAWRAPTRRLPFRVALALTNGLLGLVSALVGLWFVSRHSVVVVLADRTAHWWPWMPWWLAVLGVCLGIGWAVWRLRVGVPTSTIEWHLLTVVVGSVLVFLSFAVLPGQLGHFQGFDDAQELAGADLLSRGFFPWRDQLFIHGFYVDVLRGTIGFAIFGDTRWGSVAGYAAVLNPLQWVGLYLLAVWVFRRNGWLLVAFFVLGAGGWLPPLDNRFIAVPLMLVLLGETLRRRSPIWSVGLTVVLFASAVLVPETLFVVLPALAVVVAADLVHRDRSAPLWSALAVTRWVVGTGVGLVVLWSGYLFANHAFGAFIDYYRVFGPGHNASGAIPPYSDVGRRGYGYFGLGIVASLVVVFAAVIRFRRRTDWLSRDWVALATALFVATYGEKALGRFTLSHLWNVFTATLPLLILLAQDIFTIADRFMRRVVPAAGRVVLRPVSILALVILVIATPSIVDRMRLIPAQQHAVASIDSPVPRIGYSTRNAVSASLLSDLKALLDTYGGADQPVFDMTNSPGYFYYLLHRDPGTRFVHISMAVTPYAQRLLVNELRRSRPPVVIFDDTQVGLPGWDGPRNNVRHYDVSRYVLAGWEPVVRSHGELLLLRRDLMAGRPALPQLSEAPQTTDLWFTVPACAWGSAANYLPSPTAGSTVTLPVHAADPKGMTTVTGWAADPRTRTPVATVVAVEDGEVLRQIALRSLPRRDVAAQLGAQSLQSGFVLQAVAGRDPGRIAIYGLTSDGVLHPVGAASARGAPDSIRMPDGRIHTVGEPAYGGVDAVTRHPAGYGTVTLGPDVTLSDFDVATFHASGALGPSDLSLSDELDLPSHQITAHALRRSGGRLSVRVSSCLQWHGYRTRTLYVLQSAGSPVATLELSRLG